MERQIASPLVADIRKRRRGAGRTALIDAARQEFEDHGFNGTNSNAIARRADYAPQTFYRHFDDKLAIFLAVYEEWAQSEARDVEHASTEEAIADALIAHHITHRIFRRSLRTLTVTDDRVGAARAKMRELQISALAARSSRFAQQGRGDQLAHLFTIERLCDAIADGEFERCGIGTAQSRLVLITRLANL
jgi:AcrR family transcriptional regulator